MKFDELMNMRIRRRPGDEEHRIQCSCVRWFRLEYPELRRMLFAVPNGGRRDAVTGQKLKDEADLELQQLRNDIETEIAKRRLVDEN